MCTTSLSTRFLGSAHGTRETQTMQTSSILVDKAQQLAAAGRHTEVIACLGARDASDLDGSPDLALLYGTAQARLGRHAEGLRWLDAALEQARKGGERGVESRALNARGAMSLVSGRLDEAADYCTRALMLASLDGDSATVGRCSNNLGIVSNLRGRYAEAIGSWEIARAAFERAGWRQGVGECHHNLGITYREQGALDRALAEANRAVAEAEASGDHTLWALTLRGRAEIHVSRGELQLARRELDQVRDLRVGVPDAADEAEDARVVASLLVADGQWAAAEGVLREVIERAEADERPLLQAEATRDLSMVLRGTGRHAEAQTGARMARAIFTRLGAEGELRNLARQSWDDAFATELRGSLAPLHVAQELADAGRYGELLTYLSARAQEELEQSPMLTLLCGIAHSRLGRLDLGQQWAMVAQLRARAQEQAMQDNDMATVGRCANNLGIIANMQGDYARAVGAYTRAIAAYEQAGFHRGIAESRHNLGITYREQGRLDHALEAADAAVRDAEWLNDRGFKAQALAGRAEIRLAQGEPELAIREAQEALAIHRERNDGVLEAEDLRILAVALGLAGRMRDAEEMLRAVIARATKHDRPLLVASAQRDLASLLHRIGDRPAATVMAQAARVTFDRLGATAEIAKLDALDATMASSSRRAQP